MPSVIGSAPGPFWIRMLRTTPTVHAQPAAAQRAELELAALLAARSLVDQMRNLYR